jgi:acyl-CoA thioesterase-1
MTTPMLEKLIRFQHPESALPFARHLDARTSAAIFGAGEDEYRSVIDDIDRRRDEAVNRIAASPMAESHLQALPLASGAHMIAIGESTTADRLSWFEILRTLIQTHRPDLDLRFTNLAVSGATTAQVLSTLPSIRRHEPDRVFCMLGTNDSQRLDAPEGPLLVSPEETRRNLAELRARAAPDRNIAWVWLTPAPIDEERVARFPFFAGSGIGWRSDDLDRLARNLPMGDDLVVDSGTAIVADDPDALSDDGLHPSPTAQEALASRVLTALAREAE